MFGRVRVGVPNVHPARLMGGANVVLVLVEAQLPDVNSCQSPRH